MTFLFCEAMVPVNGGGGWGGGGGGGGGGSCYLKGVFGGPPL